MLALLASPLGRGLGMAAAVLAILAGVWGLGHHSAVQAQAKRETTARDDEKAHQAVAAQISAASNAQLVAERERVRTVTRTLIQKVPVYVPATADRDCIVPVGFVQLHDAAAAGVPGPAGGPDPAPSSVPFSAVAETVVANYGVAYDWRAEALTWRDWYEKQKAAWARRP